MAKLYPPQLEGTIPAFYGDYITVPFIMNRAVGKNEIKGFNILVKTIQTSQQIGPTLKAFKYNLEDCTATFYLGSLDLVVGQSYKFQLAYIGNDGIGFYSTVAISKKTQEPKIEIKNLNKYSLNSHIYNYVGEYKTTDITEKMYSCQFKLYDQNKKVIEETGEIIHNSLNDEVPEEENGEYWYKANEWYDLIQELDSGKNYYLKFFVKTIGLMELETDWYQIVQDEPIPTEEKRTLQVEAFLDYDNGCINIDLKHFNGSPMTGKYILSRTSKEDNFKKWNEIMRFTLNGDTEKRIWRDFTVKQGVQYRYAVFMVDGYGRYSTKAMSDMITADFEDMFLFDGEKQLRIRFNPEINGFRSVKSESKLETIGGKYPYIFRNGHINYKEFDVSGLLTHLSDDEGYFNVALAQKKFNDNFSNIGGGTYGTQLNTENFVMERDFKLDALNWLTNGKPKLFRSPSEGNYIVSLMNVSLAPISSTGRLIHTFSASAYEVEEYTHKNLIDLGIISDNLLIGTNKILAPKELGNIQLKDLSVNTNYLDTLNIDEATGVFFYPIVTEDVWVEVNGSDVNILRSNNFKKLKITSLRASLKEVDGYEGKGTFTLYYEEETIPSINSTIKDIVSVDVPIIQFCGAQDVYSSVNTCANLLNRFLSQGKEYLSQLFLVKCTRRPVTWVKVDNENNWNILKDFSTGQIISEDNNALYAVYTDIGNERYTLIGYKDHGIKLSLNDWPRLKNLTESEKFAISLTSNQGNTEPWFVPSGGLTIDSSMVDFSTIKSITSNLFLSISFSCRLGSKTFTTGNNTVLNDLIQQFQSGNYGSQEELEVLLKKIYKYWAEGVLGL